MHFYFYPHLQRNTGVEGRQIVGFYYCPMLSLIYPLHLSILGFLSYWYL